METNRPLIGRIDPESPIAFYIQLKAILLDSLKQNVWNAGDRIPSESQLCTMFDVSRTVIRRALDELEHEGRIKRIKGKGAFVTEPKISGGLAAKLTGFYDDMRSHGIVPVTHVLEHNVINVDKAMARRLDLSPGDQVHEIERLRFVVEEPLVLVRNFIPFKLCPKISNADLEVGSLYQFLESEYGLFIARGSRAIEAVVAGKREAELLNVDEGKPLIRLESISYLDDGTPIEFFISYHRADRTQFEVELVRD